MTSPSNVRSSNAPATPHRSWAGTVGRVTLHVLGLSAVIALVCVAYLWATGPTDIYRGNGVAARSQERHISLLVIRGTYAPASAPFQVRRRFELLGAGVELGSDASGAAHYLSMSVPHALLVILLAVPAAAWVTVTARAVVRRRSRAASGFDVIATTPESRPAAASGARRPPSNV